MKPSEPTPAEERAAMKQAAQEAAEARLISQLPRAQRRAATRQSAPYKRARRASRPLRRAFGGWAGAFRPSPLGRG